MIPGENSIMFISCSSLCFVLIKFFLLVKIRAYLVVVLLMMFSQRNKKKYLSDTLLV